MSRNITILTSKLTSVLHIFEFFKKVRRRKKNCFGSINTCYKKNHYINLPTERTERGQLIHLNIASVVMNKRRKKRVMMRRK
jgi:hypothetical protein